MAANLKSLSTALILFSVLGLGCKLTNKAPQVATPAGNQNSSEPVRKPPPRVKVVFTPSNNPQKDLAEAMKRLQSAYPFRWTFTQTIGDRTPTYFIFEFADEQRLHVRDYAGGEFVKIGESGFSKEVRTDNQWLADTGENFGEQTAKSRLASLLAARTGVKAGGKETVNGVSCYVYQYPVGETIIGKTWIGAADGLPYLRDERSKTFSERSVFEYVDLEVHNPMKN